MWQFRGVYTVGDPALMPLARPAAALLSLGENAVLSHRSAAAVWGVAQPWQQLQHEPIAIATRIAQALARRAAA